MCDAKEVTLRIDCPKEKPMKRGLIVTSLLAFFVAGVLSATGPVPEHTIQLTAKVAGDDDFDLLYAIVPNTHDGEGAIPEPNIPASEEDWKLAETIYMDLTGDTDTVGEEDNPACDSFYILIGTKGNNLASEKSKSVTFNVNPPTHTDDKSLSVSIDKDSSSNVELDGAFVSVIHSEEDHSFKFTHPAGNLTSEDESVTWLGYVLIKWDQDPNLRAGDYEGSISIVVTG